MIDFDQIGKRILEERKYLRRISQEKMAEDLGMYQADISNLEKAKKGSGINDLSKLDLIADYFDMPLETLLFGRRHDQMEKYQGAKMQLKECKKKPTAKHLTLLRNLLGKTADEIKDVMEHNAIIYECGPYMVYVIHEKQIMFNGAKMAKGEDPDSIIKPHLFVIYQDEVIACMTAYVTTVMQHVFQPAFQMLKSFIMPDILDLDDTLATLNPYWLLYQTTDEQDEDNDEICHQMLCRMDELRQAGEDRIVFYIESIYVREDCRRSGMCRMMVDILKKLTPNPLIWMNMEPTSGEELHSEYSYYASYTASDLGQLSLNASIAEHLGFTVDPRTVNRQAERVGDDGSVTIETVPVRKTAYYLPKKIRNILNGDGDLLVLARARTKALGMEEETSEPLDIYNSAWKELGFVVSIKQVYEDETVFVFARGMDWESHWLGVSYDNPGPNGDFVETIAKYQSLKEAEGSKYYPALKVAEQLLGAIYFHKVKPDDIRFDLLTS